MQVYLVGGAVRDELLGIPVAERDWCVVGATPRDLTDLGYRSVGRDFPVFLHPETGEEYALARTERKTRPGYRGFAVDASPSVTIEQDLARRDLTINAIAKAPDGKLLDPFGGMADLETRWLRHVSEAFVEDPVRILRVAKFAARFAGMGFRIAPETLELMRDMVASGEADALVPDRVWKELAAALSGPCPRRFFESLRDSDALRVIFPEIDALFGVPQPKQWHPEIDTGLHTMLVLDQAEVLSGNLAVRFAALVHDLGKGATEKSLLPKHPGHERRGADIIRNLARRLPIPRACRDLGLIAAEFHTHCHRALELRDETLVRVLVGTDAFRRPARFERFLLVCEADARGRTGLENRAYPQADLMRGAYTAAVRVDAGSIAASATGDNIAEIIRRARVSAVAEYRQSYQSP